MHEPTDLSHLLRPELSGLRAYVPHPAPQGVIRLDANESAEDLPVEVRDDLFARALRDTSLRRYPDAGCAALREAVAARAGCDPAQVVAGNGSDEVIALILGALSRPRAGRDRASTMFPWPSFVMYRVSALAQGIDPVAVELDERWDLDVGALSAAGRATAPNVVFVPSPNNPTGNRFSPERIEALIEDQRDALVLLDEAYEAFGGGRHDGLRRRYANVGQLQTLSKVGFAALRCGWAILPADLAREVNKVRQPYNLNAITQAVAARALAECGAWISEAAARVRAERERLVAALSRIDGVEVTPSDANFVWLRVPDAAGTHAALLESGVLVRSFHALGGRLTRQLRVTVGAPAENDALLSALPAAVSSPGGTGTAG